MEQTQQPNPLLQRVQLPGETFTLPSGGIFYDDTVLDETVVGAEVRVRPMTAIDEICLRTPDMLFSGDAVREVFQRCIPQIKDVSKLLAKDVDYLLVALRKVSYGDEMQVSFAHDCQNAKEHTYTINVSQFLQNSKKIDPTTVTKRFTFQLENGQSVSIKPMSFKDFIQVMQISANENDANYNPQRLKTIMIDSISNVITQVDDITDVNMIKEWLDAVPPAWLKTINNHVEDSLDWGPDFSCHVKCQDCGQKAEVTAPLNPLAFFM